MGIKFPGFGKGKKGSSLSRVLILLLTLQIFVAVAITSFISYKNSLKTIDEFAFQILNEATEEVKQELGYFKNAAEMVNKINIDSTQLGLLDLSQNNSLEKNFLNQLNLFEYINLISVGTEDGEYLGLQRSDETGKYIFASAGEETGHSLQLWKSDENKNNVELVQETADYDPRLRPWYMSAAAVDGSVFSPIYAHASTGEFLISASQAFYSEEGDLLGVYSSNLTLSFFEKFLSTLSIGKTGQTFIIERSGLLVASSEPVPLYLSDNEDFKRLMANESNNKVIAEAANHYFLHFEAYSDIQNGFQEKIDIDGNSYYLQIVPFSMEKNMDWVVFVVIPQNDFMGQILKNSWNAFFLIIGSLLVSIILGVLTSRWASKPVRELNKAARSIAQGKWIEPLDFKRSDEIGELTQTFNQMALQLQDSFKSLEKQIEEQKKIEEALRESEEKFRLIIENASEGVVLFDLKGKIIEINESAAGFAQIPREMMLNRNIIELKGDLGFNLGASLDSIKSCMNGQSIKSAQTRITGKDGVERIVRGNLTPVKKDSEIIGVSLVVEDITGIVQSTEEMVYLRRLLTNIIDSMPSILIGINKDRQITHWNRETQKYTGKNAEEVLSKDLQAVFPELFKRVSHIEQKLCEQKLCKYSKTVWEEEKDLRYFDVTLYPLVDDGYKGAVIRLDDVTEQVQTEELLIQSEKMLSLGGLAAGMAHEINNPLAGIMQNAQVIQNRLSKNLPKNQKAAEEVGTDMRIIEAYIKNRGIEKMIKNISESGQQAAGLLKIC